MGFSEAVKTCFSKYVDFTGRAQRSEFWFWILFAFLGSVVLGVIDGFAFADLGVAPLSSIFSLAILLPNFAVGARRLHDMNHSGWWQLLGFILVIGSIILLVWMAFKGTEGENRFGPDPLAGGDAGTGTAGGDAAADV